VLTAIAYAVQAFTGIVLLVYYVPIPTMPSAVSRTS